MAKRPTVQFENAPQKVEQPVAKTAKTLVEEFEALGLNLGAEVAKAIIDEKYERLHALMQVMPYLHAPHAAPTAKAGE